MLGTGKKNKEKDKEIEDLREENTKLLEEVVNLNKIRQALGEDLEDRIDGCRRGDFTLEGEDIPAKDLVRVLREEVACTHHELKCLQEAIKASQILLAPHLGE